MSAADRLIVELLVLNNSQYTKCFSSHLVPLYQSVCVVEVIQRWTPEFQTLSHYGLVWMDQFLHVNRTGLVHLQRDTPSYTVGFISGDKSDDQGVVKTMFFFLTRGFKSSWWQVFAPQSKNTKSLLVSEMQFCS